MKLRHLEIFYAVMTCGSLSRAAEALNISQPAASKALKSAEMKLGFTLFQRVRGKLLPTSEAITLSKKRRAFIRTWTTCACWPTTWLAIRAPRSL